MKEPLKIRGIILIELFGEDGRLKESRSVENIITTVGRGHVIDRLQADGAPNPMSYCGIGTGATAAVIGDTTLQTEVGTRQGPGALSQPDAFTDRLTVTFAAGNGTGNITEAARFNASSAGNMMGRQVFTAVNKTSTDSLQITYDFLIS